MKISVKANSAEEMRQVIVNDLKRREQIFRDSIRLQSTKATKQACYVAAQAFSVAANDYKNMIIETT